MGRGWGHVLVMSVASIAIFAGCNHGDEAGYGSSGISGSLRVNIEPITTRFIQVQDNDDPTNVAMLLDGSLATSTGASGLDATGTAIAAVISGGATRIDLSSTTPFTKVQVSIGDLILYYELTLPAPTTSVSLIITISTSIPIESFKPVFRLGDGAGAWGKAFEVQMLALSIPSGEVQVSVSWDALTDVDLHVTDPAGEEIYFSHKTSASGGSLDLDANAACSINDPLVNNESIHWPEGSAPTGSYLPEVNYWSSCEGLSTNYILVVQRKGHDPLLFTGSFTGSEGGLTHTFPTFTFP